MYPKINNILEKFRNQINSWSLKRKILYGLSLVVIALIIFVILKPKDNSANITTDTVKLINLKQTILATGQVTSDTDLDLSFFGSGIVRSVRTVVGDKVYKGQILATLDQGNKLAALTQARAGMAAAQAKYDKLVAGASNEEIILAEIALLNAKRDYTRTQSQQELLVSNAYKNLLNSTYEAVPASGDYTATAPTISGNYSGSKEGQITLSVYNTGSGRKFSISGGLETGSGEVNSNAPQQIGTSGLYVLFSDTTNISGTIWTINIPNTKASNYLANYNSYQAALKTQQNALGTAQATIDQREAELSIKKSQARKADIDLAEADILSAKGQYQLASANFEDTILRAPAAGTITKVDIKLGELAQSLQTAMVLQDINNVYLEANINEANIVNVRLGAPIEITFDAFGTETIFIGEIITIDPSSTIISGVVNYKVTANIINPPELRPGMTANMTILAGQKDNVLVVPSRAIIRNDDGSKSVRLITNTQTKEYVSVPVVTGMGGDGGLVEISSGLAENDEIVILIKK